jgi:hypothetical protein
MGRRLRNNCASKNLGHVGITEELDLRWLMRLGLVEDGEVKVYNPPLDWCSGLTFADLRAGYFNKLVLRRNGVTQTIPLTSRKTNFGGQRWYLLDEEDRKREILYFGFRYFCSRKLVALSYWSQSEPHCSRLKLKKAKLDEKLKGARVRGPARGANRRRLKAKSDRLQRRIDREFDEGAISLITRIEFEQSQRRARRELSKQRFDVCNKAMNLNKEGVPAETILARYGTLLSEHRARHRPYV